MRRGRGRRHRAAPCRQGSVHGRGRRSWTCRRRCWGLRADPWSPGRVGARLPAWPWRRGAAAGQGPGSLPLPRAPPQVPQGSGAHGGAVLPVPSATPAPWHLCMQGGGLSTKDTQAPALPKLSHPCSSVPGASPSRAPRAQRLAHLRYLSWASGSPLGLPGQLILPGGCGRPPCAAASRLVPGGSERAAAWQERLAGTGASQERAAVQGKGGAWVGNRVNPSQPAVPASGRRGLQCQGLKAGHAPGIISPGGA